MGCWILPCKRPVFEAKLFSAVASAGVPLNSNYSQERTARAGQPACGETAYVFLLFDALFLRFGTPAVRDYFESLGLDISVPWLTQDCPFRPRKKHRIVHIPHFAEHIYFPKTGLKASAHITQAHTQIHLFADQQIEFVYLKICTGRIRNSKCEGYNRLRFFKYIFST